MMKKVKKYSQMDIQEAEETSKENVGPNVPVSGVTYDDKGQIIRIAQMKIEKLPNMSGSKIDFKEVAPEAKKKKAGRRDI